ncbi:MAG: tRNA (adenosine(37)-N6)-dimethylallyltransferase MiaA [bacterium]|nr:tRNA (adenosine(37)-N6)-dimethylallyltransferase MiaA [bacterium]
MRKFDMRITQKKPKILVIVGPTASGKSALAVEIARKFNCEIVSADSRQVYKGLDLGTGKITKREMKNVRHYLLDVSPPKRIFTAHDFLEHARHALAQISSRGNLPIIAGGTGFYIDALVGRISLPNVPENPKLREQLEKKTAPELFSMLKKRDPARAETIDRHNKRRLVRALEIVSALGQVPQNNDLRSRYDVLWVGISRTTKELGHLIRARLRARMRHGMLNEAKNLHKKGLSYKRMESFGLDYKCLALLLQKKISREKFDDMLVRESIKYAKRQITYWNRNREIKWFNRGEMRKISGPVANWLQK